MPIYLTLILIIAAVIATVVCLTRICFKDELKLAEKIRLEDAQKARAEAEASRQRSEDMLFREAVAEALRILLVEAREYDHKQERRPSPFHTSKRVVFPRELREAFHKILRVGALEGRVDSIEERNIIRGKRLREIAGEVSEIRKVIDAYV